MIITTLMFIQEAHAGQKYGAMPYFYHPVEVMHMVNRLSHFADLPRAGWFKREPEDWYWLREVMAQAALLHDVIEDTSYTATDLLERFDGDIVAAVELLTKDDTLDYRANIQRIIDSGDIAAMFVKLADNLVNRHGDKSHMDAARATKLNTRYDMSIDMLVIALGERGYKVYNKNMLEKIRMTMSITKTPLEEYKELIEKKAENPRRQVGAIVLTIAGIVLMFITSGNSIWLAVSISMFVPNWYFTGRNMILGSKANAILRQYHLTKMEEEDGRDKT